jgi:hypothetical protein
LKSLVAVPDGRVLRNGRAPPECVPTKAIVDRGVALYEEYFRDAPAELDYRRRRFGLVLAD